jgi:hypothetical protein
MPPSVAPAQAGLDALQCMGLGLLAGAVRCCLPRRRAGALCADFLLAVLTLLALQSFSACRSAQGVLRWYMLGGAAAGAAAGEALLAPVQAAVLSRVILPKKQASKHKKTGKMRKKRLQKAPELLYNSNV